MAHRRSKLAEVASTVLLSVEELKAVDIRYFGAVECILNVEEDQNRSYSVAWERPMLTPCLAELYVG